MKSLFLLIPFIYFYNIFIILPNIYYNNFNLKTIFLLLIQGIFISILEQNKQKEDYQKTYPFLLTFFLIPSYLINIKLCFIQLLFLIVFNWLNLDENQEFFAIIYNFSWIITNLLFLIVLNH